MKRIMMLVLTVTMIFSMAACAEETPPATMPTEPDATTESISDYGDVVLLFTGGLNGVYGSNMTHGTVGYAALRAYASALKKEGNHVILIDGGDSVDPQARKELWEIVDACSYDIRVPGMMELSSGVNALKDRAKNTQNSTYLSCNLLDTFRNTTVFDSYAIVEIGNVKLGFVGVTRPQLLNEDGYTVLGLDNGQLLRDTVQRAIDDATDAGADFVIVVGNLGTAPEDSPCTTVEIVTGITDMAVWLDCGSGAVLDGDIVEDKDNRSIPLCAPGADFSYIGQIRVDLNNGSCEVDLLTDMEEQDRSICGLIEELNNGE